MNNLNELFEKIEDNKFYTLRQIYLNRFFFWYKDQGGVYRTIRDKKAQQCLKPVGVNNRGRAGIKVQGKNIKSYILAKLNGNT